MQLSPKFKIAKIVMKFIRLPFIKKNYLRISNKRSVEAVSNFSFYQPLNLIISDVNVNMPLLEANPVNCLHSKHACSNNNKY